MAQKLVVLGGSGFIGREVCRVAVQRGYEVVSLSRRGAPGSGAASGVRWLQADVASDGAWKDELRGATAVIHTLGILREHSRQNITFKRINGDSAILAGEAAVAASVEAFVFLSSAEKPPLVHEEYLTSKRRAEVALQKLPLRVTVLRPGFVYGIGRAASLLPGAALRAAWLTRVRPRAVQSLRPIAVHEVARAAVRAAFEPEVRGVIDPEALARLGW
jgi:uncharacterized protein YbjT (DUF2867 family)